MKETLELRINYDYASLLFTVDEGKNLGTTVKVVELTKGDPRYDQIPEIERQVQNKYNSSFFFGWEIKRKYGKKELDDASLFQLKINTSFEPSGEECGTVYNLQMACEICGANRKQVGLLNLKRGSLPSKDIAKTIAGEVVVSERFAEIFDKSGLKGVKLEPVLFEKGTSNYYQLVTSVEVELSHNSIAGINPFDLSTSSEGEIYKCPNGHTIGLNLLSEAFVLNSQSIEKNDFFKSKQKIGVKRGLLQPEPLYFCSPDFWKMVKEEKLNGFDFEIAHID
jgi:hypothetical protein